MKTTEKKCECGCDRFIVCEDMIWNAFIDENNDLQCSVSDSQINLITCAECEKEYTPSDFTSINFN